MFQFKNVTNIDGKKSKILTLTRKNEEASDFAVTQKITNIK